MSDTSSSASKASARNIIIGHQARAERYTALRDVIARERARAVARKAGDLLHGRPIVAGDEVEEFWALQGRRASRSSAARWSASSAATAPASRRC